MATSCQLGTAWVPSYVEGPSSADRTLEKAQPARKQFAIKYKK